MNEGDSTANRRFPSGFGTALFPLPDVTYALLRDLSVARTGVLFDGPKRGLLADKLSELVAANGLTSFLDYYYLLRYEATESHWNALMDRLAVPETFFWRQAEQIDAFARIVLPAHLGGRSARPLRVWSAACCSGEEPLSLAIALAEVGLLSAVNVEITATDGSSAMIDRAKRGVYGERSFRQLPPGLKEKYFEPAGDRWRPADHLSRQIRWGVANLARPAEVERYAGVDVIFCRNVFIYFSDDAIRNVVRVFSKNMARDGYLFLGASESLTRLGVDLELAEVGNAFAYVKEGRQRAAERERPSTIGSSAALRAAP
jgi:chemotaxis protein methyltransferase CheR